MDDPVLKVCVDIFKIMCRQYTPSDTKIYHLRRLITILNPDFDFSTCFVNHKIRRPLALEDIKNIRAIRDSVPRTQFLGSYQTLYHVRHTLMIIGDL